MSGLVTIVGLSSDDKSICADEVNNGVGGSYPFNCK